ncbi:MAG: hypothetical protein AAFX50_16005, partial [Acidobacteriota bacterium]
MAELAAFAIAIAFVASLRGKGNPTWERAATKTKLEFSNGLWRGKALDGRIRDFDVKVFELKRGKSFAATHGESVHHGNSTAHLWAEVRGVDPGFGLAPEYGLASLVLRDIETGDRDFDAQVRVTGDPEIALPVLGLRVRRAAAAVVSRGGTVEDGKVLMPLDSLDRASARLRSMITLAELLRRPADAELPKLLAQQALKDKSPGVRVRAFRQLLAREPGSPLARSVADKLLGV